jgi:aspartyl-tRNA(Asn)/glutamyl-tRNA(Gln) amidotransferase subunit B
MEQAIKYEVNWQIEQIEDGHKIQQATILFDPDSGETRMMRSKEDAHDYRYFPDPDLPPLVISEDWIERVRAELPELPEAMQARFQSQYGISAYDAATLTSSKAMSAYYEAVVSAGADAKLAANWIMGDISASLNREEKSIEDCPVSTAQLAGLICRLMDKTINNKGAKDLLRALWESDKSADALIDELGLKQTTDTGAIEAMIDEVLAANAGMVAEFKSGKEKAFNALVGQCMKAAKGKADPATVNDILKRKLG